MMFVLGFISGVLLSFLCIFVILSLGPDAEKVRALSKNKMNDFFRNEVDFLDPGNSELDAMEILYEENKQKGESTAL